MHAEDSAGAPGPKLGSFFLEVTMPPSVDSPRHRGETRDSLGKIFVVHLWDHALSGFDSVFEQLVFLASLRDGASGEYQHWGLELPIGSAAASKIVRASHQRVFAYWLSLTTAQQKDDFERFLARRLGRYGDALNKWRTAAEHLKLFPPGAAEHERNLYLAEMEILIGVLDDGGSCSRTARALEQLLGVSRS